MQNDYQHFQIDPALLQMMVNIPSKKAAGLDALNQSNLFPGIDKGVGSVSEIIQKKKQQAAMQQLLQQMQGQPQAQSMQIPPGQPATAGLGNVGQDVTMQKPPMVPPAIPPAPSPQGGMPPGTPQGQPDLMKLIGIYMKSDPQGAQALIGKILESKMGVQDPLKQAQTDYLRYKMSGGAGVKPTGTVYRNSSTGEMTDDPSVATGPEWKAYKTTQGDVLNKLAGQTSGKERNKAIESRSEVYARGIDARQIDRLVQAVGVTPAQRNLLQQNNMRANRAIELASKPMTWQEFGAVTTDAAAIMQGGSPQVQQLHDMSYPSWKQDLARANTYATSTPQATVPDEFKNRIIGMIKGIQTVDNRYLIKNAEFMQKMMAPTIRGGIKQFKSPIEDMTKTITESDSGNNDLSSMSDDELRKIAGGH